MYLLQDDPTGGVPWGRPPVAGIPVPPFADQAAARSFVANLCVYLALLDGGGPVGLPTFGLLTLMHQQLENLESTTVLDPMPAPLVLTVAMLSYYPAPWTPHGLNDACMRILAPGGSLPVSAPDVVGWGSDPGVVGRRDGSGSWTVTSSERGTDTVVARFASDDDMVLYRMSVARTHPMPFGWSWNRTYADGLERAACAAQKAWTVHTGLPYLSQWQG